MPSAFIRAVHSYPAVPLARQLAHQRYVPPNPLVLRRKPRKSPAPRTDRDRPDARRSKPSSRTAFIGEQPNPWELLHPQDAMSRHRGAKPPRRCERSGEILVSVTPTATAVVDRSFLPASACRHAARTISSPSSTLTSPGSGAPRLVSEAPDGTAPESHGSLPADCPHP